MVPEHAKTISRSGPNHLSMSKAADDHKPTKNFAQSFEQMDGNDAMQANVVPPESFSDKWTDDKPNSSQNSQLSKDKKSLEVNHAMGFLPSGFFDKVDTNGDNQATEISQQSENVGVVQLKQVKGALPAGFFDNKDADLRARGIEPVKVDIKTPPERSPYYSDDHSRPSPRARRGRIPTQTRRESIRDEHFDDYPDPYRGHHYVDSCTRLDRPNVSPIEIPEAKFPRLESAGMIGKQEIPRYCYEKGRE
ncbi:hypothetical protein KSP40_PGU004250 [Platanthera guangdongensis]|uniref:Uncharacterized protein n=1 Tax=Platanthera guangdongensis TaxID=2320717 RepID=A0ABR2LD62_9ASPA